MWFGAASCECHIYQKAHLPGYLCFGESCVGVVTGGIGPSPAAAMIFNSESGGVLIRTRTPELVGIWKV